MRISGSRLVRDFSLAPRHITIRSRGTTVFLPSLGAVKMATAQSQIGRTLSSRVSLPHAPSIAYRIGFSARTGALDQLAGCGITRPFSSFLDHRPGLATLRD